MKKFITYFTFLLCVVSFANTASAQCSVSGSSSLSPGQSSTYYASTQSGASYFWSATGGLSITSGNTGSSVTVKGNSSGTLYYTRYKSGVAPCIGSKSISVANPTASISYQSYECIGGTAIVELKANLSNAPAGTKTYQWSITSGNANIFSNTSASASVITPSRTRFTAQVVITVNGVSYTASHTRYAPYCNGNIDPFIISPNPSSNDLTIESDIINKTKSADVKYETVLLNKNGKVVMRKELTHAKEQFNTSSLPKGLYFVRTSINNEVVSTSRWIKK